MRVESKHVILSFLFIILTACILGYGRYASIIYPFSLNPDEAQVAANALLIKRYGIGWNVLDGTTCGFLHSLSACWPYLFHKDVTYSTLRITAFCYLLLSTILLFFTIKKASGISSAIIFSTFFCLFFAATNHPDFLHYNSEILPLTLILLANFSSVSLFLSQLPTRSSFFSCFTVGFCLASVFFSKLQAVPIALTVFIFCLIVVCFRYPSKKIALILSLFAGTIIPTIPIFILTYVTDSGTDFFNSYILWGLKYSEFSLSLFNFHRLLAFDNFFLNIIYFCLALCIAAIVYRFILIDRTSTNTKVLITYYFILVLVSSFCTIKPGNLFPHYLTFILPMLLLFTSAIHISLFYHNRPSIYYLICAFIFCFYLIAEPLAHSLTGKIRHFGPHTTPLHTSATFNNQNIFSWLNIKKTDSILIWGWMPQWYALTPATPATRETHTFAQIVPSPLREYFRSRFLKDFQRTQPDFIIDGVTKHSFGFNNSSLQGIQIFQKLYGTVTSDYTLLTNKKFSHSQCPAIYIRNDRSSKLLNNIIEFSEITAQDTSNVNNTDFAPGNVADYSVTEDVCHDYWLLPEGKLGALDIAFSKPEPVAEVRLLNTNNGIQFDRSTETVRLSLYNEGKVVFSDTLTLHQHPEWTPYKLERPITVDAMRIDILSFKGRGAGLNEIVALRATP
ncbi:hypothetical protein [Solidesulfovibrio alcoholivorans]|uniref:hypothetical protein n=1 Tax=Solidesulfovibrio alcoholivorans TaxID=81406 RepID=UPI000A638895|nr:hypothetical protein [Solidesulfovibrio alcoholivorans]